MNRPHPARLPARLPTVRAVLHSRKTWSRVPTRMGGVIYHLNDAAWSAEVGALVACYGDESRRAIAGLIRERRAMMKNDINSTNAQRGLVS